MYLGLARVLAGSPRITARVLHWGGDEGMRRRYISNSEGSRAVPANGPAANESRRLTVETLLLRITKRRAFLRALSQNRASASRVSLCYRL